VDRRGHVAITPDRPVALDGQRNVRISKKVGTPLTATALALQSRDGDKALDEAILVSCDLVGNSRGDSGTGAAEGEARLSDFDLTKLSLCATHSIPRRHPGSRYTLPTAS